MPSMTDPAPESPDHEIAQVAGASRRLAAEFVDVDPEVIGRIVLECHRDLRGVPAGALPELVERHARQRLLDARGRERSSKAVRAAGKATEPAPRPAAPAIRPPALPRARRPRSTPR
jgi:sRNA-binding protein